MTGTTRALQLKDSALLHPLIAYPGVGEKLFVPIVAIEARALAHHYPLVWRRTGTTFELGALISLSALHKMELAEEISRGVPLPLSIEAYPLSLALDDLHDSRGVVLIEDADADPTKPGMPVFMANGAPSAEATRRLRALEIVASDHARTTAYTRGLAELGLLVDWPLRLKIGEEGVDIEGLCVLVHPLSRGDAMKRLVAEHGFSLAELVTLHDLSMFNMQRLTDRHRRAQLRSEGEPATPHGALST